jgi:superfamily I DNA/RNA helicase
MELLSKRQGIKGGRIQDGKLIVVDRNNAQAAEIQKAVAQLGASDQIKSGEPQFIRRQEYDDNMRQFRDRKSGRR